MLSNIKLTSAFNPRTPIWLEDIKGNKIGYYLSLVDGAKDLGVNKQTGSNALKYDFKVTCKLQDENNHTIFGERYKIRKINLLDEHLSKQVLDEIRDNILNEIAVSVID